MIRQEISKIVLSNYFPIDKLHGRKHKYKYFKIKFDSAKDFFKKITPLE